MLELLFCLSNSGCLVFPSIAA